MSSNIIQSDVSLKQMATEIGVVFTSVIEKVGFDFSVMNASIPFHTDDERTSFMRDIKNFRKAATKVCWEHITDWSGLEPEELERLYIVVFGSLGSNARKLKSARNWKSTRIRSTYEQSEYLLFLEAAGRTFVQTHLSDPSDRRFKNIDQIEWFTWFETLINISFQFAEMLDANATEIPDESKKVFCKSPLYEELKSLIIQFIQRESCDQHTTFKNTIANQVSEELVTLTARIYSALNESLADRCDTRTLAQLTLGKAKVH